MEYSYFYKTTNLINKKFYYGVHKTLRLNDGYLGSGVAINLAIKKYGRKNFSKEIILFFKSYQECLEHEALIVDKDMIKNPLCYNLQTGGKGYSASDETRLKMSASSKGRTLSAEAKAKVSMSKIGIPRSIEAKLKMSNSSKGKIASSETRAKQSYAHKNISDETRLKLSIAGKGKSLSTDHKAKLSASHKGKPKSKEHIIKIVASKKENYEKRKLIAHLEKEIV
jgi:hypothetical protein